MYTEYKTIFMEKKVVRSLYTMEPACLVCRSSEYLRQGCGGLYLSPLVTDLAASRPPGERECGGLSLSPLVTDPAASRPPGERECGGLSLSSLVTDPTATRPPGEGSAVASLSLTVGH